MAISEFEIKRIEKIIGEFVERRRPPREIRDQVDLAFRIHGQSFEIYEIRPQFDDPAQQLEIPVAKATYVKKQKLWKLFWMRADGKWHGYEPMLTSPSLEEVSEVIDRDDHGCFWG